VNEEIFAWTLKIDFSCLELRESKSRHVFPATNSATWSPLSAPSEGSHGAPAQQTAPQGTGIPQRFEQTFANHDK
jgi:hypothetical protein